MTGNYVHGYATVEQQRLFAQAEHWRDELIVGGTTLEPGTRLLEVGCGVGAVLGVLGQAFSHLALAGVDIEARQIEVARRHLDELGLMADLRRGDALELPYEDGSFDHVWMMWFLEHVAEPVAVLREARRVLVPPGRLTAIEVDYNTVWARPESVEFKMLFDVMARAMEGSGRSDAGTRLPGWLAEAGFGAVEPGARRLHYSGDELPRQVAYVESVVDATLPTLKELHGASVTQLELGVAHLKALPDIPDAAIGWVVHKSHAIR
jgi:ubiquinone/menaquinone biosynthesis C-methylase UbiE